MDIEILKKSDLNDAIQSQISDLYNQLNSDIDQSPLKEILQEDNHVIFAICKIKDDIVGIALLATYKVISGHRGMVEDVVVDATNRGKGIGRQLMARLIEEGKKQNLDGIMLFTGHHREAAINLYKSLGFTLRKSGLYNLKFT